MPTSPFSMRFWTFRGSLIARAATGKLVGYEDQWYVKDDTYMKMFRTNPIRDFPGLRRYQMKRNEHEREVVEAVSSDSYRKSHNLPVHAPSLGVTHKIMHNWLLNTGCDEIDVPRSIVDATPLQVLPDGTGYKGPGCGGRAVRGI